MKTRTIMALAGLAFAAPFTADAPARAAAFLDQNGNPSCNNYIATSIVGSCVFSNDGTKTCTSNGGDTITIAAAFTGIQGGEEFSWTLNGGSAFPNVVIVNAQQSNQGSRSYFYGGFAQSRDDGLRAPGDGNIKDVSVCFGSTDEQTAEPPPIPPSPRCETTAGGVGTLAGVSISCPAGTDETRIVTVADPDDPNFGIEFCTCQQVFTECDPSAPASDANSCIDPMNLDATAPETVEYFNGGGSSFCLKGSNPLLCYKR